MDKDAQQEEQPAWGVTARGEPRWPASLAVIVSLALYVALPDRLRLFPVWILPALEIALLAPLSIAAPRRHPNEARWQRYAAVALIALVNAANFLSLVLLVEVIIGAGKVNPAASNNASNGTYLIFAAFNIWLTNVLVFALWYWELDRGGPDERTRHQHRQPDFLFPQMSTPACTLPNWRPHFIDYLYVSFTNATAFSPTDTMPLTAWAKLLMMLQSVASLLTVALVAARAVNIIK